ncbi:putative FAD binding domain-containing protein [Rosellinia necatrix]|uniref:Putative FAD binding domain-containing protein n=1 Tax=Rosellinia necatrix TaxID=77044 RepID=A0A1W2TI06_ROSNE|nr:putative FAD binding domain-containing protein [Rosellinia necatrix]
MRFTSVAIPSLLGLPLVATQQLAPPSDIEALQDLGDQALGALQSQYDNSTNKQRAGGCRCNLLNAKLRRDWRSLSSTQRKEYIAAVKCLQTKPSIADPTFAPGSRTRYDDFVAVHINQTLSIHGTGNFLSWHRYFVHTYETALRDECGYTGYQPYWNWLDSREDPSKSPIFDGTDTSFSGDGAFAAHNGSVNGNGNVFIPSGKGGGCVTSGPFVDYVINLGPVSPIQDKMVPAPVFLGFNPHCLSRDLSAFTAMNWLTLGNILNITVGAASRSVLLFQNELQGRFTDGFLGLHTAGHGVMGGAAGDIFGSPVDPVFFLHHAMVDRTYWLWQALHPFMAKTIAGTITLFNEPPSRDTSVDDLIDLGVNAPPRRIGDLLDTLGGAPLCYIYV